VGQGDLPLASGRQHARAFERRGWTQHPNRGKGHIILTKPGHTATLSVPDHDEVKRATLAKLIVAAGMTIEEYCKAFRRK
jgi:hypothetical protein